jgi:hypothetical protein
MFTYLQKTWFCVTASKMVAATFLMDDLMPVRQVLMLFAAMENRRR